jgi:hypothetical protein
MNSDRIVCPNCSRSIIYTKRKGYSTPFKRHLASKSCLNLVHFSCRFLYNNGAACKFTTNWWTLEKRNEHKHIVVNGSQTTIVNPIVELTSKLQAEESISYYVKFAQRKHLVNRCQFSKCPKFTEFSMAASVQNNEGHRKHQLADDFTTESSAQSVANAFTACNAVERQFRIAAKLKTPRKTNRQLFCNAFADETDTELSEREMEQNAVQFQERILDQMHTQEENVEAGNAKRRLTQSS